MTDIDVEHSKCQPNHIKRIVTIGDASFGGAGLSVIAGPCSVEWDYVDHAKAAARAGADVLRGCVYKPRSAPGRFEGIGSAGIPLLRQAREATGLPIISEPLDSGDVETLYPHVQAFLVGARSMRNSRLLQVVGETRLPVILKRSFSATYDEWLGAADYVRSVGNHDVVLCERGIRTFNTETRNTLDISAVPVLRDRTDLPVIVDPSHAAGKRQWVTPLALAAVSVGADGLLVESHPVPEQSWTDKEQALCPADLESLIAQAHKYRALTRCSARGGADPAESNLG